MPKNFKPKYYKSIAFEKSFGKRSKEEEQHKYEIIFVLG